VEGGGVLPAGGGTHHGDGGQPNISTALRTCGALDGSPQKRNS
jgi:hypothetical protein